MSDELLSQGAEASLLKHPLIISVTPQRRVTRSLKTINIEDDFDEEDEEAHVGDEEGEESDGGERWTRGRRSLAFGEF